MKMTTLSIFKKIENKMDLPVNNDVLLKPNKKLKSKHPVWNDVIGQVIYHNIKQEIKVILI